MQKVIQTVPGDLSNSKDTHLCSKCQPNDRQLASYLADSNYRLPKSPQCDTCSSLAKVDGQITSTQDLLEALFQTRKNQTPTHVDAQIASNRAILATLFQSRSDILTEMNNRHDTLTCRLPIEIVSWIFQYFVRTARNMSIMMRNASFLGSMCKKWRAITLETPQLWTTIEINLSRDCVPGRREATNEWLRRSRALPLHIRIFDREVGSSLDFPSNDSKLIEVLRSHSSRWRDFELLTPSADCFYDLQDIPPIDTLKLSFDMWDMGPVRLQEPLRPKKFVSTNIYGDSNSIPLRWDNLTHLEIGHISNEALLDIIRDAVKITSCKAIEIWPDRRQVSSIPSCQIISHSMERFETDSDCLSQLTLPSLQYLHYKAFGEHSLDPLVGFTQRSGAPLETFILEYDLLRGDNSTPSFEELPQITHLDINFYYDMSVESSSAMSETFFQTVSKPSDTGAVILPLLQSLTLSTRCMSSRSWASLSEWFPHCSVNVVDGKNLALRPLHLVTINIAPMHPVDSGPSDILMDKLVFLHLREVKESRVTMLVKFMDQPNSMDLIDHVSTMHDTQLDATVAPT